MRSIGPLLARLWVDKRGISAVEYAMLLAMITGGIIMAVEFLSGAASNEMNEAAGLLEDDSCGNQGDGDGTGGDGGSGQGGANTC